MKKTEFLSEFILDPNNSIEFAERVHGTYAPKTIELRRKHLELTFASVIQSGSRAGALIGLTRNAIECTIEDGFGHLLDTVKGSNHPIIQRIREDL